MNNAYKAKLELLGTYITESLKQNGQVDVTMPKIELSKLH